MILWVVAIVYSFFIGLSVIWFFVGLFKTLIFDGFGAFKDTLSLINIFTIILWVIFLSPPWIIYWIIDKLHKRTDVSDKTKSPPTI